MLCEHVHQPELSGGSGEKQALAKEIRQKRRELSRLARLRTSWVEGEVLQKSMELDKLVVAYMKEHS